MTDRDASDDPPMPVAVHGRRTRVVVALIGLLLSLGVPVVVLGTPVPTVDGHPAGSLADPAGLGVTGSLPGDASTGDPVPGEPLAGVTVPGAVGLGDSPETRLPGIPTPPLPDGPLGIPGVVLDAYQFSERTLADLRPGCHLSWSVLAGIGRIESDHASDGRVDALGNTLGLILGPQLDGSSGVAAIPDTDHGQLDTDPVWDRAVGPMQFIPSSWRNYGVDGNGDGVTNPNNIYDATVATGMYLCTGGTDLSDRTQLSAAIYRYNHSATYVAIVLQWAQAYLTGFVPTPSAPGPVPPGINGNGGRATLPDTASLAAAAAAALPQPTPLAATLPSPSPGSSVPPLPTSSPLPLPPTPTPLPTATTSSTTESSPPPATSTEPSVTTTAAPMTTTAAPETPQLPATTTTPVDPAPTLPPSPPATVPTPTVVPSPASQEN
jgi:hypothetical protein